MRNKEKEITDFHLIEAIIKECQVCRLGVCEDNQPYVIPLNFGYKNKTVYFHSAPIGKKVEMLKKNNRVCVEFDTNVRIVGADKPCAFSAEYKSVVGFGEAKFIEDPKDKTDALNIIMNQYTNQDYSFPDKVMAKTALIRVELHTLTGKQSGN